MQIISASRRTDIPAFYMPWFMERLRAGTVTYPNPIGGQEYNVSLAPDDVHSIVFWTKFAGPLLDHLDELHARDYRFTVHFTITGAPHVLEPYVPRWEHTAEVFRTLAERTSARHVHWRFDPMVITDDLSPDYYATRFAQIAAALSGATTRCTLSFATFYGKVERRMRHAGIQFYDPTQDQRRALLEQLADSADAHGITLYACCQDALLSDRIHKAHCIDGDLLADLFPDRPLITTARPSRKECGCVASRHIGMYDTCPFGCVYCYANVSHTRAVARRQQHDPAGEMLIPRPDAVPA